MKNNTVRVYDTAVNITIYRQNSRDTRKQEYANILVRAEKKSIKL